MQRNRGRLPTNFAKLRLRGLPLLERLARRSVFMKKPKNRSVANKRRRKRGVKQVRSYVSRCI